MVTATGATGLLGWVVLPLQTPAAPYDHNVPEQTQYVISASDFSRTGRIISESADGCVVAWRNGQEQRFPPRSNSLLRPRQGSIEERYAMDPDAFRRRLVDDSVAFFVDLVRAGFDTSAKMQKRLVDLGLDKAEVQAGWRKARTALERDPHIVKDAASKSYRWSEAAVDPLASLDHLSVEEALAWFAREKTPKAERDRLERRLKSESFDELPAPGRLLAWGLGLVDEVAPATHLDAVDERAAATALDRAKREGRWEIVESLALLPAGLKAAQAAFEALPEERIDLLLTRAVAAMGQPGRHDGADAVLLRAQDLQSKLRPATLERLIRARLVLDRSASSTMVDALDALLMPAVAPIDAIRKIVETQDGPLPGLSVGSLAPESFRPRALVALRTTSREGLLHEPQTWSGLDVPSLLALMKDRPALIEPLVDGADSIGGQLAREWLESAPANLQTLAAVLAWPRPLVTSVGPEHIAGWIDLLRGADEFAAALLTNRDTLTLQREVADLRSRHLRAEEGWNQQRQKQEAEAVKLQQRVAYLQQLLGDSHASTTAVRDSELRQAQIDAARSLASVLDEVFLVETRRGSMEVWSAAADAARPFGITPIGKPGEPVLVDPVEHEAVQLQAGEPGTVRGPGYAWTHSGERLVLKKALVSPEQ